MFKKKYWAQNKLKIPVSIYLFWDHFRDFKFVQLYQGIILVDSKKLEQKQFFPSNNENKKQLNVQFHLDLTDKKIITKNQSYQFHIFLTEGTYI